MTTHDAGAWAQTPMDLGGSPSFRTTHWSLVLSAGGKDGEGDAGEHKRSALASLLQTYWYPVYAYARRKGHGLEDARDLVQSFFTGLLESGDLSLADAERGRFRTFLLSCFSNFSANQWKRENAKKRGGGLQTFSLDQAQAQARYAMEPATEMDAERVYQGNWARALMERVLLRLGAEYEEKGRIEIFEGLKPMLAQGQEIDGYGQVAKDLGVTEGAVKVAAHRLRRRFGELLRLEISHTVRDPEDIDDEIRGLFEALGTGVEG